MFSSSSFFSIGRLTGQRIPMHRPMFIVQIMASTFIICLTAFMATISVLTNMTISIEYLTEMIAALVQLLDWCWAGKKAFDEVRYIHYIRWWHDNIIS